MLGARVKKKKRETKVIEISRYREQRNTGIGGRLREETKTGPLRQSQKQINPSLFQGPLPYLRVWDPCQAGKLDPTGKGGAGRWTTFPNSLSLRTDSHTQGLLQA